MRFFLVLCLLIQLAGCASNINQQQERLLSGPPQSLIAETKRLQQQSNWAAAERLLKAALVKQPKHPDILSTYEALKADWKHRLKYFEDQILVIETRALKNKLPYLENKSAIDPNNIFLKSRKVFWRQLLISKVSALVTCGEDHLEQNGDLSRNCLLLANEIEPSQKTQGLLTKINRADAALQTAERSKQQSRDERDKVALGRQLVVAAKAALEAGEYTLAIDQLNSASKILPDNKETTDLLSHAIAARDKRVEELLEVGDEMYRNEHIEQAVTAWEAANLLAPGRSDIAQRIDRAGNVLKRLEQIRRSKSTQ